MKPPKNPRKRPPDLTSFDDLGEVLGYGPEFIPAGPEEMLRMGKSKPRDPNGRKRTALRGLITKHNNKMRLEGRLLTV